jgi:hypothetical protein
MTETSENVKSEDKKMVGTNKSESIKNLLMAFTKFQAEIRNPKSTATNPHFKSKYAPLNEVLNVVRPVLSKYGLSVVQNCYGNNVETSVVTILFHESGEFIESGEIKLKNEKATAQGMGSSVTYARRYSLNSMLGISSDGEDIDGNDEKQQAKTDEKQDPNLITIKQAQLLFTIASKDVELVKKVCEKYGYTSTKEIKKEKFDLIMNEIKNRKLEVIVNGNTKTEKGVQE